MFFDLYVKRGNHWRALDKKPSHDAHDMLKTFRYMKGYGAHVVLVMSNTDPRLKDRGLRLVVSTTKNNVHKAR